jgi:hypothetical protein
MQCALQKVEVLDDITSDATFPKLSATEISCSKERLLYRALEPTFVVCIVCVTNPLKPCMYRRCKWNIVNT